MAGISRRVFLRVAGSLAGAAVLAGCAPAPKKNLGPHGSAAAQLVYQDWRTDYFAAMAQNMLEEFHATHPNIHVFYTPDPPTELAEKMMTDFQAQSAPDVFAGCCDFFPIWAQKGYLMDLRPYVAAELTTDDLKDWDQAQYRSLQMRDGSQYGLPKYHGALALYYNKDLFDEYQIPYPDSTWTHSDYYVAVKKFVQPRADRSESPVWGSMFDVSWDRIQVHVNSWGGHFVSPTDPRKSLMARPQALDAMQWLRDRMWSDHAMASRFDVQNLSVTEAFIRGRLAMVEDGSWSLMGILQNAPFRVGVTVFPAGPASRATVGTTDGFAIFKGTRYPEAAWEFMKFLISPRYGRAMSRAHLLQPARASLVEGWIADVREQFPGKSRDLDLAAFADGHLKGYSVTPEVFENQEVARQLAMNAWEQIFTLGRKPVSHMRDVSAQIEAAQAAPENAAQTSSARRLATVTEAEGGG